MKKIIPCLDTTLDEKGNAVVVKGVEFEELKYAGDPVELAKKYDREGADELVFLDITASTEGRERMVDIPRKIAEQISIPLCIGGGIRSLNDFRKVFDAGADKAGVNTAAVKNPGLIKDAARTFGSERVVAAIDCKRSFTKAEDKTMIELKDGSKAWYDVVIYGGKTSTGKDAVQWALEVEKLGAGAILLTSKDRDGTKDGYDILITRAIAEAVDIPVIASGGCGNLEHMYEAFVNGVDACLAASIFHYGQYTIKEAKEYLRAKGIPVKI